MSLIFFSSCATRLFASASAFSRAIASSSSIRMRSAPDAGLPAPGLPPAGASPFESFNTSPGFDAAAALSSAAPVILPAAADLPPSSTAGAASASFWR